MRRLKNSIGAALKENGMILVLEKLTKESE
jgi:hypothetical protein